MKLLLCAFAVFIPVISFGQTIHTGYAVVAPTSGTGNGLSVSETFGELVGGNFFQASVIASPLVTVTNVVINSNSVTGVNTGIAMVNPNNSSVTVTMTLGNQQGLTEDTRTLTIGTHQQISKFITEYFNGDPVTAVGPLTGVMPLTGNTTSLTNVTGQVMTVPTAVTALNPVNPSVSVLPQLSAGVGGQGAQLLPQVAAGGGWNSQITIANTSGVTQAVRVDFFNPDGGSFTASSGSTVMNIVVPPTGVATVAAPTP